MSPSPPRIVIVGAGFSGAATAAQLLRHARAPLRLWLLNESGRMARGLAYGTTSALHVLNVPAGNMSALADEPAHFLQHVQRHDSHWHSGSFVPRPLYGEYLEALLDSAEAGGAAQGARLQRVVGRALQITPPAAGRPAAVALADGRTLQADAVVLAFGHVAAEHPLDEASRLGLGPAYIGDPWQQPPEHHFGRDAELLLVGAGLTALDMLVSLHHAGHRGALRCVSRRGLAPQPHRVQAASAAPPGHRAIDTRPLLQQMGPGLRTQVHALRRAVAAQAAEGGDWRDLIAALRPHMPLWWQALPDRDRRRFLRHLQAHWDSARHRCAPEAHAVFERLRASGQLVQGAARLHSATRRADGRIAVQLRLRGAVAANEWQVVDGIVNCTAPSGRIEASQAPLLRSLLAEGLVQADALALGLQVDAAGRVIGRDGQASHWLHYVGPLLKARDWEATAIPELRQHALALAQRLLAEWPAAAGYKLDR
jgi:uncharacterized NAD(P)/FAD-binding protein YdhS